MNKKTRGLFFFLKSNYSIVGDGISPALCNLSSEESYCLLPHNHVASLRGVEDLLRKLVFCSAETWFRLGMYQLSLPGMNKMRIFDPQRLRCEVRLGFPGGTPWDSPPEAEKKPI